MSRDEAPATGESVADTFARVNEAKEPEYFVPMSPHVRSASPRLAVYGLFTWRCLSMRAAW